MAGPSGGASQANPRPSHDQGQQETRQFSKHMDQSSERWNEEESLHCRFAYSEKNSCRLYQTILELGRQADCLMLRAY